jgi:hypothetical protein
MGFIDKGSHGAKQVYRIFQVIHKRCKCFHFGNDISLYIQWDHDLINNLKTKLHTETIFTCMDSNYLIYIEFIIYLVISHLIL